MTNEAEKAEEGPILLPPADGGDTRQPRRDFFGALVLVAIAAAFIVQSLRMPFKDPSWDWYTAPNIFPLAMGICLGAAASFVVIRGFVSWRANVNTIGSVQWSEAAREWGVGRFVAAAVMIAGLIFLLGKINFYLLAPGSIMVFGLTFRSDPLAKAFKSSLIAAVFIVTFLFAISKIFGIVFP